jgi:CubicO group peptidase (beta-lactamase class C family)
MSRPSTAEAPRRLALASPSLFALIVLVAPAAVAADPPSIAGHWTGTLKVGGTPLALDVDFSKKPGGWAGDISIPAQGARDLPLQGITIEGDQVAFKLADVPGHPSYKGKLAPDGSSIKGTFTQAGKELELELKRAADPIAAMKKSLEGFDAVVDKAIKDFKVPGLAMAVVKDGQVIYAKGFGKRDVAKDLPVTPQTLFAIGSCTKAFTTFVMGTLVEEGKLEWDTPVRTYLPGFRMSDPIATESITPRDLVTHRSGLPRHDMVWYNNARFTGKDLIPRLAHFDFTEPLRSKFQYNNLMFVVAGHLIETIDGRSWEQAIRARIFQPLGMTSSNVSVVDSQKASDFAQPYDEQEGKVRVIPFRDITNVGPAGSINSNVLDMGRWVAVHTHGGKLGSQAIISPAVLNELHTPQMTTGQPSQKKEISPGSYALGWGVDTYRGHRRVHHGGAIDGFTAETCLFPDDGLGIVVLNNKKSSPLPSLIGQQASDRLLGLEPIDWLAEALDRRTKSLAAEKEAKKKKETVRRSGTHPAHPLEEYAGDYQHPGYGPLKVELRDGRLVSSYNGIEATLEHWHFEVFDAPKADNDPALADFNMKFQFQTNFKGYVDAVAVPLEPSVKPIVFTKHPDKKLADPEYLKRFAGEYELAGQTVTVRLQGHVLMFEQKGAQPRELVPDRDDEFNLKGLSGLSVRFVSDRNGKVLELALNTLGGVFSAKRK